MRETTERVCLFLMIWLVTRILFFSLYGDRMIFDEASYLYEVKLLSEGNIHTFSQGPVLYYTILPAFKWFHSIAGSKFPLLLFDLFFLLAIYYVLRSHNERVASYAALFYTLAPMSAFVANHVVTDIPALLFTFLSIYFFVRYHAKERTLHLVLSGVFLLLGGLTKEMDFFLYIFFPLYLLLWHWRIERVPRRVVYALAGLIVVTFLIKLGIMTGLWEKNPTRLMSMFFLPFKNGGFLNAGILYFVLVFFVFVNPLAAVLGYPKVYLFLRDVFRRRLKVRGKNVFFRLQFISSVMVVFLIAFFTYFGANEARYVYFVVPFLALFAAEKFASCSKKRKAWIVMFALFVQVALMVEYEKDSEGFDALGTYLDALPTHTIYTDEPLRPSEYFVPGLVAFKTQKKIMYLLNDEIPRRAKDKSMYALSYHRSGIPTLDEALKAYDVEYKRVTFVVSDYERHVYAIGEEAMLPQPTKTRYSTFFTQPLRTPPEEALYHYLIQVKRNFCATPREQRGWFKYRACAWGE